MKPSSVSALVSLAVLACTVPSGSSARDQARASSADSHAAAPVLYGYGYDYLARLNPLSLRIERKLSGLGPDAGGLAFSPDGSQIFQGAGFMGGGDYAIADARQMRWLHRSIPVAKGPWGYGYVEGFRWLRPNRVFALDEGTASVAAGPVQWTLSVILDPSARRVVARRRLPGFVLAHEQVGSRIVMLLVRFKTHSYLVAVCDASDHVRYLPVRLPRAKYSNDGFTAVGFAVDKVHQQLFLLPGRGRIAVVNLRRLTVRYRAWPQVGSRPRARAYVRPSENHEGDPVVPQRSASWLGNGVIGVTGEDDRPGKAGTGETVSRPYGLELIDTRDWSAKLVAPRANRLTSAGGAVFVSVSDAFEDWSPSPPGLGLTAYSRTGGLLFHKYGRAAVSMFPLGRVVYAQRSRHVDVLSLPSGRLIQRVRFGGERRHQLFPGLAWQRGKSWGLYG